MSHKLLIPLLVFLGFVAWWQVMVGAVAAGSVHVERAEQWQPPPVLGLPPAA
jgi:hypothetical protein